MIPGLSLDSSSRLGRTKSVIVIKQHLSKRKRNENINLERMRCEIENLTKGSRKIARALERLKDSKLEQERRGQMQGEPATQPAAQPVTRPTAQRAAQQTATPTFIIRTGAPMC